MSYTELLSNEGIKSQFLAVLKPKKRITSWVLVSGTKYQSVFSFGEIVKLTKNGQVLSHATSALLSDGVWHFDYTSNVLTIDIGENPSSTFIVATFEIYLGTYDAHFNRIPTDSTSRVVYYEPLIVKSPTISQSVSDVLFGFLPTQSSTIIISNATQFLQEFIYDASLSSADLDLYHYLDSLKTENVKLIFKGICSNITYTDTQTSITVFDRNQIFTNEYRHKIANSFYTTTLFPNLDPQHNNRPIRNVFGMVEGFLPVNISYQATNPTTSDNRSWICIVDETALGSIATYALASPVSTTTITYVNSTHGLKIGDSVWIDSSAGPSFDESVIITYIGSNYIQHAAITNAAASGSLIKRSFVSHVKIYQNNVEYTALYGRDYTEIIDSLNKVSGFIFSSNLESNLGITTITPIDVVHCRIFGHQNLVSMGVSFFGSNDNETANLTQGIVILYDLLRNNLGLSESEINLTDFISLQSTISDSFSFSIPELATNDFPTYRDLITSICSSLLLKVYLDDNNKWTCSRTGPMGSVKKTIQDDEILKESTQYNFKYEDILSKIIVQYFRREVSEKNEVGGEYFKTVSVNSQAAQYLHGIDKQKTFTSLHFRSSEALALAKRLCDIYGDRQGSYSLSTKNRFFDSQIGDVISVERNRMPGFSFDVDINRARQFSIISINKSLNNINIEMSDQKGIQDNSGSW